MRASIGNSVFLVLLALLQHEVAAFLPACGRLEASKSIPLATVTPATIGTTTTLASGPIFRPQSVSVVVLQGSSSSSDEDDSNEEFKRLTERATRINGSGLRGQILQLVALGVSVWIFTIPPDLRRYNICSEQQAIQYPESCISTGQLGNRLADYYKDGFKVQWDFSVGERTKNLVQSLPGVDVQL